MFKNRSAVVLGAVVALVSLTAGSRALLARGGWAELPWVYCYDANPGEDEYVPDFNTIGCLDGDWRRSSNSDQWDGSSPEEVGLPPNGARPGGAWIELLAGEGEDGGQASVLGLEDVGNPTTTGFAEPSNRKIYLWRDTTDELDLAAGVTLVARWRLNPEPTSSEFDGVVEPVPNGTYLHDSNKGQIGFTQRTPLAGTIGSTLNFALTDEGYLQFGQAFGAGPCSGIFFPDELCLDLVGLGIEPGDWVTVWMTAQEVDGEIDARVYLNGETVPELTVEPGDLIAIPANAETATRPEAGDAAASYINIALGSTGQTGAIQVDYVCVATGFIEPSNVSGECPGGALATASGGDVTLTWTNGATAPASVAISRDGVEIAGAAPADPPTYVDSGVPPGEHTYRLTFTVPGQACMPLEATIDTCPGNLTAAVSFGQVALSFRNPSGSALRVTRDGVELETIAADATAFVDAAPVNGPALYALAPLSGTCAPLEISVTYAAAPAAGDYSGESLVWTYSLDPPPAADPAEYLLHDPEVGAQGDLDGFWASGNGSDSWDGSAPGEIGDPIADPLSASPGGIGLVADGAIGAYLIEDTGNPTTDGWADPSNRKIYLGYDLVNDFEDTGTRSVINDGVTLRARFRLTPAARAVDVASAPAGIVPAFGGKGMFSLVHDTGATAATPTSQRIGFALNVNTSAPGTGVLTFGEGANLFTVFVADPTAWLDLWMTVEDPDPFTPEVTLELYLNGSLEPVVSRDDFIPNDGGSEGAIAGVTPGNVLYMGVPGTDQIASIEVDLVCLLDGVTVPGGMPVDGVGPFRRGDCNADAEVNLTDGIFLLNFLFLGGATPACQAACDNNGDGQLNITTAVYLFNFLFLGGGAPPSPPAGCGSSSRPQDLALGCAGAPTC